MRFPVLGSRYVLTFFLILLLAAGAVPAATSADADAPALGLLQLPQADGGWLTVYYPAAGHETLLRKGPFALSVVPDGVPVRGNGHLVVVSHGSGGSPWVHADLARTLVQRGFTVALPQHHGDNYLDGSTPGPVSWRQRPREVSQAIDAVGQHRLLGPQLDVRSVGVVGGSAGGHTALSLAGGQWSEARFRDHCERHIAQDFSSCVGFLMLLRGDWGDSLKLWAARHVIDWRFTDETLHQDSDPRIKAAVAMVPFAADFVPDSLRHPRIPLGLVIAERDVNQVPGFHVKAVLDACKPECEVVMDLPDASHGVMLSPMPPLKSGSVDERLLADPPGFDRAREILELNMRIATFLERHLITDDTTH
jgi:predicted dienelactone hydrolase